VTLVHSLEESYFRVTGEVNILGAISYELHKSSCHFTVRQEKKSARPTSQKVFIAVY
jgi:hypothetical protein